MSTEPSTQPSPTVTASLAAPAAPTVTEPLATPTAPTLTATSEPLTPAGWATDTRSQSCGYVISYPPEMQAMDEGAYSQTYAFRLDEPGAGARNWVYVSVIDPEIQNSIEAGGYDYQVYNYDPAVAEMLLNMGVGERRVVNPVGDMARWFTYERKPDTLIGAHSAQTYENNQPWEFPSGTKEIRYYLSLDGCTYLIGGYVETANPEIPGAITEELFNQIVATWSDVQP
jgi:hypothetical protein